MLVFIKSFSLISILLESTNIRSPIWLASLSPLHSFSELLCNTYTQISHTHTLSLYLSSSLPLFLFLPLSSSIHTLSLSISLSHTHKHTNSFSLYLSYMHTPLLSPSLPPSLSLSLSLLHTHSFSPTSLSLTHTHSFSLTHTSHCLLFVALFACQIIFAHAFSLSDFIYH